MGVILNELNEILDEKTKVVNTVATQLHKELEQIAPVGNPSIWKNKKAPKGYTSGTLSTSFEMDFLDDGSVVISNNIEYAEKRLAPLVISETTGGVIQGSRQYPAGIEQVIDKYERILKKRLSEIK